MTPRSGPGLGTSEDGVASFVAMGRDPDNRSVSRSPELGEEGAPMPARMSRPKLPWTKKFT